MPKTRKQARQASPPRPSPQKDPQDQDGAPRQEPHRIPAALIQLSAVMTSLQTTAADYARQAGLSKRQLAREEAMSNELAQQALQAAAAAMAPVTPPKATTPARGPRTPLVTDDDDDIMATQQYDDLNRHHFQPPRRSPRLPPPRPFKLKQCFSGLPSDNVNDFITLFRNEMELTNTDDRSALLILPKCLTDVAGRWFLQAKRATGSFDSLGEALEALTARFTPTEAMRSIQNDQLRRMRQGDNESVVDYNVRFEKQAATCTLMESDLKNIYVDSLIKQLGKSVLLQRPSSCDEAMREALSLEVDLRRRGELAMGSVNHVERPTYNGHKPYPKRNPCRKCGGNHATDRCGVRCKKCGKLGHTENECRSNVPKRNDDEPPCTKCHMTNHARPQCWRDPDGPNYRPPPKNRRGPKGQHKQGN